MLFNDTKIFKYRYDFEPQNLLSFITNRYYHDQRDNPNTQSRLDRIRLNGNPVDHSSTVSAGDWIEYTHHRTDEKKITLDPEIIYEDDDILVISKPDYLPVVPNSSYYFTSLAIYMKELYSIPELSPVHRLDIETSGVLIFGKSRQACAVIQKIFQNRNITKIYQAVTFSKPTVPVVSGDLVKDESSKIFTKLKLEASNNSGCQTRVIKVIPWGKYYRLWISPLSGKTNQIRAHLAAIGCPIVGDKKYYPDESVFLDWYAHRDSKRIIGKIKLERHALFCESLRFVHPYTKHDITLRAPQISWLKKIRKLLYTQEEKGT